MKHSRNLILAFGLMLSWHVGVAADEPRPTDSPGLRVSETLTAKRADEAERTLLRLEARVGQTLTDDRAVISDLLARLNRMTATVAEVHKLITAIPAGKPCKPVAAPCPTIPAATSGSLFDDLGDAPWLPLAGAAAILGLAATWLTRRRKRQPDLGDLSVMAEPVPVKATETPPQALVKPTSPATAKAIATEQPPVAPNPPSREPAVPPNVASATAKPKQPDAIAAPSLLRPDGKAKPEGEADLSLELADVMLSMGLTDGAAQTLSDHIREHPRQALYHWLKLLDIYRQSGMKAEFDKAAEELQRHFNIAPPEWQGTQPSPAVKVDSLEDYPHISSRVQELWPRRSCAEYLHRLLEDNRGGTRAGFPQPVIEDILLLLSLIKD